MKNHFPSPREPPLSHFPIFPPVRAWRRSSIIFATSCLIDYAGLSDFLRESTASANLNLFGRSFEISDRRLHSFKHFGDGRFEDKAIEGHHGHHRVIRINPDSMLDRNLGSQPFQVTRSRWGVHFRTAPGRAARKDPVGRSSAAASP